MRRDCEPCVFLVQLAKGPGLRSTPFAVATGMTRAPSSAKEVVMKKAVLALLPLTLFAATPAEKLAREVRHELVMLPYYNIFDNLAYRVDGDTVTLYGQVVRPTLKDDAEKAVKSIE